MLFTSCWYWLGQVTRRDFGRTPDLNSDAPGRRRMGRKRVCRYCADQALLILIWSQVILSLQLPFTVIPLVWLTSRRDVMGRHVNQRRTTIDDHTIRQTNPVKLEDLRNQLQRSQVDGSDDGRQ